MFTFPLCHFSNRTLPTIEYLYKSGQAAATTYTFSSVPFGDALIGRIILVGITGFRLATRSVTSVTIGGVSATVINGITTTTSQIAWAYAEVPTDTTGNIVVAWDGDQAGCQILVHSIKNCISSTPTINETINGVTTTISPTAETAVIAHSLWSQTASGTTTWSGSAGLSETSDNVDYNFNVHSSAVKVFESPGSSLEVTFTPSGTPSRDTRMQIIGFR